jgi:hypothetical protein
MESKEEERTSSNKKRDPPCLTELFQNQKEKKKKQYDTNINHIHSMEIIMQETADLYVMLYSLYSNDRLKALRTPYYRPQHHYAQLSEAPKQLIISYNRNGRIDHH